MTALAPKAARVAGGSRTPRAARTVATLALAVVLLVTLAAALDVRQATVLTALVSLVAVVGIGAFSGNSGILSFGHVAFMAIAAYAYGLLTMTPAIRTGALPELPGWLAGISLSPPLAILVTLAVVAVLALPVGFAMMRLSPQSGTIATLALLLGTNALLLAATDFTRGAQTFYGVTGDLSVATATIAAVVAIALAHAFRQSRWGLGLRASRDSGMAAASAGVDRRALRLAGWLLSAVLAGAAGIALAVFLGAFSPSSFYLDLTFTLVAMLIVGGAQTTTGAVAGVALVTIVLELSRQVDSGVTLGPISTPEVFGFSQLMLGVVLLVAMTIRPAGLVPSRELDDLLAGVLRRRRRTRSRAEEAAT